MKLRQGSGKDGKDGKDGQGWARMALKVKGLKAPLPRAYIKLGCHPPTTHHHPPASLNKWLDEPVRGQVRLVKVRGGV